MDRTSTQPTVESLRRACVHPIFLAVLASSAVFNIWASCRLDSPPITPSLDFAHYSWLGSDHPIALPVDLSTPVEYKYLEDVDALSEDPYDVAVWDDMVPEGFGDVNLGPEKRRFTVSMFHQLHCLMLLRRRITQDIGRHEHLSHCLNYLRSMVLCAADVSLEPEIVPQVIANGVPRLSAVNVTHTCRDWTKVQAYIEDLYWSDNQ